MKRIKNGSRVVVLGNGKQNGTLLGYWQKDQAVIRLDRPLRRRNGDQFSIIIAHTDNVCRYFTREP
jgi:hypothetical protein